MTATHALPGAQVRPGSRDADRTDAAALQRQPIPVRTKVALNAARGLSAAYVVAFHLAAVHHVRGVLGWALSFGQQAVMVFFLLSGYLIFANELHRVQSDLRGYYLRRVRRVYPTLLVALAATAMLQALTRWAPYPFEWRELAATLLGMADLGNAKPGVISEPFMGDGPLWSLGYEMFFYAAFPLLAWCWRRGSASTAVGVAAVTGYLTFVLVPNHWSLVLAYLQIWWLGAALAARATRRQSPRVAFLWTGALVGVATAAALVIGDRGSQVFPMAQAWHFAGSMLMAGLAVTPVAAVLGYLLQPLAAVWAYLASISYGLYVMHYPLLINTSIAAAGPQGFALMVLVLVALCIAGDRLLSRFPWERAARLAVAGVVAGRAALVRPRVRVRVRVRDSYAGGERSA